MGLIRSLFFHDKKQILGVKQPPKTASTQSKDSLDKCILPYNMPRTEGKIGNVSVSVAGGDMTQIKADAYVVPEFDDCISEGGVGGAIYRSGAEEGMEAYGKYIAEKGKLNLKDIFIAESGGGYSKYLIHAVTVGANKDNAYEVARDGVFNALTEAQKKGIKSVVIPAIGTGIIGSLTNSESANAILNGVKKFADNGGKMDVCAVVYSTGAGFNDFSNVLKSKSYENPETKTGTKDFNATAFASEMAQVIMNSPRIQKPQSKYNPKQTPTPLAKVEFTLRKSKPTPDSNGEN